jgi:hypothetical protein
VDPQQHPWNRGFEWHDHTGPFHALDEGQVRDYDRHGYVVIPDLVRADLLPEVTAAIDPTTAVRTSSPGSTGGEPSSTTTSIRWGGSASTIPPAASPPPWLPAAPWCSRP